jgi:hypothetical protein
MFTRFFSVDSMLLSVSSYFLLHGVPQRIHSETQLILCVLYENFALFAVKKFLFLYSKIS